MIKKVLLKLRDKIFRKQDKKLDELQKKVNDIQKKLDTQKKQNTQLKSYIEKEFKRRDLWTVKKAEVKWLAKDKKVWVIKAPFPDNNGKFAWGEYFFSSALQKALEDLGYFVVVQSYDDWYCEIDADYVLVLRGRHTYHPDRRNEKCKYILWHVCHPDMVSKEEYELYDLVYVDSLSYAEKLDQETTVPVKPLLVCVDTNIFCPKEEAVEHDLVFVGNTRGVKREFVSWCENHKLQLQIWGGMEGWKKQLGKETNIKLHGLIDNSDLPDLYRKSKVILNDHFSDMREQGFLNNRILEALCSGRPLLSDYCPDFEKLFGDSIVYYKDEEDFVEKLKYVEEHYEEQRQKVLDIWPMLQAEFSFEKRAKDLVAEVTAMEREEIRE